LAASLDNYLKYVIGGIAEQRLTADSDIDMAVVFEGEPSY